VFNTLNCVECFMRGGNPGRPADFVVNGQSLCQKHVHKAIRERGQSPLAYTWAAPDDEPVLEST
jgi:hypothetical protein